jgi:hAT family C-terminal dimerisation region
LDKLKCTKLLRDGASNAVTAANTLGVSHMSCVAHSIHLVVSGALIKPKRRRGISVNQPCDIDEVDDDLDATNEQVTDALHAIQDCVLNQVNDYVTETASFDQQSAFETMQDIVQVFRKLAIYYRRSPKGANCLNRIQAVHASGKTLSVILDCPTRWNSTWAMLERFLQLKSPLQHFFNYLRATDGRAEFKDFNLKAPTPQQWFAIACLYRLLTPFTRASTVLGGDTYPTLAMALPCLRALKRQLQNEAQFDDEMNAELATSSSDEHTSLVTSTCELVHNVRQAMLDLYVKRFKGMGIELLWISYLDPRLVKMAHLTQDEVATARMYLVEEMIKEMERDSSTNIMTTPVISCPIITPKKPFANLMSDIFGRSPEPVVRSLRPHNGDTIADHCNKSVDEYIARALVAGKSVNPLDWWQHHKSDFPVIAALARKWLGCVATSVSSERAFSTSGNIVTAKRACLAPSLVRDLVFISQNHKSEE